MEKKFEVFSAISHNHDRTGADQLRDFTYRLQEKLFAEGEKKRASISSTEELESYNKEVRKQFLEGLGSIWPRARNPAEAAVTRLSREEPAPRTRAAGCSGWGGVRWPEGQ